MYAPISSVAGGDETTWPHHQGAIIDYPKYVINIIVFTGFFLPTEISEAIPHIFSYNVVQW
jgi:hypothetical protein